MKRLLSSLCSKQRLLAVGITIAAAVLAANFWIIHCARGRIVSNVAQLPQEKVGLVLGTAPMLHHHHNPFFENRMDAAALLYREGKVSRLLLSGDNHRKEYDEPTAMREALVARGVPASAITLDYAGLRTLDSMYRARAIFGVKSATIVTDRFHEPRALFLARAAGLEAIGYPSAPVPLRWAFRTTVREVGARVKACLDVYVLGTRPKFYGKPEPMAGVSPSPSFRLKSSSAMA